MLLAAGVLRLLAFAEPTILTSPFGVTFQPDRLRLDGGLALVALGLAVVVALAFALAPALRAARRSAELWRSGAGVRAGGLRRLRLTRPGGLLVAAEIAVAISVTVPALLLARSLETLVAADLGFRPESVATADCRCRRARILAAVPVVAFVTEATRRLRQDDAVESVSWTSCLPIECGAFTTAVTRPGPGRPGSSHRCTSSPPMPSARSAFPCGADAISPPMTAGMGRRSRSSVKMPHARSAWARLAHASPPTGGVRSTSSGSPATSRTVISPASPSPRSTFHSPSGPWVVGS